MIDFDKDVELRKSISGRKEEAGIPDNQIKRLKTSWAKLGQKEFIIDISKKPVGVAEQKNKSPDEYQKLENEGAKEISVAEDLRANLERCRMIKAIKGSMNRVTFKSV